MAFANYLVSYVTRISKPLVLKHFHPYVSDIYLEDYLYAHVST